MIDLIQITGNNFRMGDFHGDYLKDSLPKHKVFISDFRISKYLITQDIYEIILGKNPSNFKNKISPVEMVSWFDCIEFCNKLSERMELTPCYSKNGKEITCFFNNNGFRLPTEAEWEFAAREGGTGNPEKYSGSGSLDEVGWYKDNSGNSTHNVGEKRPNKLQLYDMSGNVWEWCQDWYGPYTANEQNNPSGPRDGSLKVYRGGSYLDFAYSCTVSIRGKRPPHLKQIDIGFRVVKR